MAYKIKYLLGLKVRESNNRSYFSSNNVGKYVGFFCRKWILNFDMCTESQTEGLSCYDFVSAWLWRRCFKALSMFWFYHGSPIKGRSQKVTFLPPQFSTIMHLSRSTSEGGTFLFLRFNTKVDCVVSGAFWRDKMWKTVKKNGHELTPKKRNVFKMSLHRHCMR